MQVLLGAVFLFWIITALPKLTLATFHLDCNIFPSVTLEKSKAAWVVLQLLLYILIVVACRSLQRALLIAFEVSGESSRDGGVFLEHSKHGASFFILLL